jgi:hypothetical protein
VLLWLVMAAYNRSKGRPIAELDPEGLGDVGAT